MPRVIAGSRLLLHTADGLIVLRSLRDSDVTDVWCIPVIGDVAALHAGACDVDVPTDDGPMRVRAILRPRGTELALYPVGSVASIPVQRRRDVRGAMNLPLRAEVLSGDANSLQPSLGALAEELGGDAAKRTAHVFGTTTNLSAGGLSAQLDRQARLRPGVGLYVELDLPDGDVAPAVVSVVEQHGFAIRARFIDIAPRHRERLARLVFARQRAELADRRRLLDDTAE